MIVPAPLDALQAKRITMLTDKGITRQVKAKAAHITIGPVGKPCRHQLARIPAMRDKSVEQEPAILHVDDKKPFLSRRKGKIDDR